MASAFARCHSVVQHVSRHIYEIRALVLHAIPILFLFLVIKLDEVVDDRYLLWFCTIFIGRYFRLFVSLYGFWRYEPVAKPAVPTVFPKDVTVVIPTVSSTNPDFEECLTMCFANRPAKIIIVADKATTAEDAKVLLLQVREAIQGGSSKFLPGPMDVTGVKSHVKSINIASKRQQMVAGIASVATPLTVFLDDHVFMGLAFLESIVPVFEHPRVGLCGTRKDVRRVQPTATGRWGRFCELFWNHMGIAYLHRHNFEIRATNALDGGVFVVSGRALAIRTAIVQDPGFRWLFTNEPIWNRWSDNLEPDDDNFITRWNVKENHDIRIQYTDDATVVTTLGSYPKFLSQCLRWARTTYRSNIRSLLIERNVWYRWAWTVWTALIPGLFNLALVWDPGMIYTLVRSEVYANSPRPKLLVSCLVIWIYLTKFVKLAGYYRCHPRDFALFFFPIPAYLCFAYFHSFLKFWAALTFWDGTWGGRNLKKIKKIRGM